MKFSKKLPQKAGLYWIIDTSWSKNEQNKPIVAYYDNDSYYPVSYVGSDEIYEADGILWGDEISFKGSIEIEK